MWFTVLSRPPLIHVYISSVHYTRLFWMLFNNTFRHVRLKRCKYHDVVLIYDHKYDLCTDMRVWNDYCEMRFFWSAYMNECKASFLSGVPYFIRKTCFSIISIQCFIWTILFRTFLLSFLNGNIFVIFDSLVFI